MSLLTRPRSKSSRTMTASCSLPKARQHPEPSATMADFNGDRRDDYASVLPNGSLHIFTNASPEGHWSTARIKGIKNLKLAPGATVEMKSGAYYEKRVYDGVPLAFAIDGRCRCRYDSDHLAERPDSK